ncbi:hypothetical protein [Longirhabdus pacifica]|uniref:hypothetical protein n=1 Tax=Longirhabdus pacifica TaxID=2305227 RepID=UPI0010088E01|nr:hypothetical protein [Longirhabdus pacifica]
MLTQKVRFYEMVTLCLTLSSIVFSFVFYFMIVMKFEVYNDMVLILSLIQFTGLIYFIIHTFDITASKQRLERNNRYSAEQFIMEPDSQNTTAKIYGDRVASLNEEAIYENVAKSHFASLKLTERKAKQLKVLTFIWKIHTLYTLSLIFIFILQNGWGIF